MRVPSLGKIPAAKATVRGISLVVTAMVSGYMICAASWLVVNVCVCGRLTQSDRVCGARGAMYSSPDHAFF